MKMFSPRAGMPTVIAATVVVLLSLATAPSIYNFNMKVGAGNSCMELIEASGYQNVSDIPEPLMEKIKQKGMSDGIKRGTLMLLGQHFPISILILLTVGLISKSTTREFKRVLCICFFVASLTGIFFLSLALYPTVRGTSFPELIISCFLIYLVIAAFMWTAIGIGYLINRNSQSVNREVKEQIEPAGLSKN